MAVVPVSSGLLGRLVEDKLHSTYAVSGDGCGISTGTDLLPRFFTYAWVRWSFTIGGNLMKKNLSAVQRRRPHFFDNEWKLLFGEFITGISTI